MQGNASFIKPQPLQSSPWFDPVEETTHLYSFGDSPGYANKEVKIFNTFEWIFFTNKIERPMLSVLPFEKSKKGYKDH
jgi:hypothetical protein